MEICPIKNRYCSKAKYDKKYDTEENMEIYGCDLLLQGFTELEENDCPLTEELCQKKN